MKRTTFVFLGFLILLLFYSGYALAQLQPAMPDLAKKSGRSALEGLLSIGVLAFGLLFSGILTIVAVKCRTEKLFGASYLKLVGLTLVITAGLFLICAGYSQDQIAPMIGLLGTIAGYLLGKGEAKEKE